MLFVLSALTLCAGSVVSSLSSGLYGIGVEQQLFSVDLSTGSMTGIGPDHESEGLAQQVSTIDAATAIYYCLGYNLTIDVANIIGLSLETGAVVSSAPITAFIEPQFIGAGQNIAYEPDTGGIIISGQNAAQDHLYGLVSPQTGLFTLVAQVDCVPPQCLPMLGGPADYAPDTHVYLAQLGVSGGSQIDFEAINVSSGHVVQKPDCDTLETLYYDKKSGAFYGIGLQTTPTVARTLVKLAPDASGCAVVGLIPDYFMISAAVSAIDEANQILYWIAAPGGYPVNYTLNVYNLVATSLKDASTISEMPFCCFSACNPPVPGVGVCPWSLEYYNAP